MHYACQKQCHVCLGSHLTKPCLSCVVTSKTAAIHVKCQHSMCNLQDTPGSTSRSFDQEGLPFSLLEYKRKLCTFYHAPSYAPSKQMYIHLHAMHLQQPSLVPRLFFWNKTTMHLPFIYIYAMHTLQGGTYMLDLSFSTYSMCCKAANSMWRINTTPLPRQHTRTLLISHSCSGVA